MRGKEREVKSSVILSETKNLLKGSTGIDEILHSVQYDKN